MENDQQNVTYTIIHVLVCKNSIL